MHEHPAVEPTGAGRRTPDLTEALPTKAALACRLDRARRSGGLAAAHVELHRLHDGNLRDIFRRVYSLSLIHI